MAKEENALKRNPDPLEPRRLPFSDRAGVSFPGKFLRAELHGGTEGRSRDYVGILQLDECADVSIIFGNNVA